MKHFERAARSFALPLTVVRDSYTGARHRYEHPWVLVRPDQFVAWAGDGPPADPVDVLRRILGHEDANEPRRQQG